MGAAGSIFRRDVPFLSGRDVQSVLVAGVLVVQGGWGFADCGFAIAEEGFGVAPEFAAVG